MAPLTRAALIAAAAVAAGCAAYGPHDSSMPGGMPGGTALGGVTVLPVDPAARAYTIPPTYSAPPAYYEPPPVYVMPPVYASPPVFVPPPVWVVPPAYPYGGGAFGWRSPHYGAPHHHHHHGAGTIGRPPISGHPPSVTAPSAPGYAVPPGGYGTAPRAYGPGAGSGPGRARLPGMVR